MNSIERNLEACRAALLNAQTRLAFIRQGVLVGDEREYERYVCKAIDRAWEAQCMAQGSL